MFAGAESVILPTTERFRCLYPLQLQNAQYNTVTVSNKG